MIINEMDIIVLARLSPGFPAISPVSQAAKSERADRAWWFRRIFDALNFFV
jgi:hypothetical protein